MKSKKKQLSTFEREMQDAEFKKAFKRETMNYKVNYDRSFTYISGTDEEEVDNESVFENLRDAKRAARNYIGEEIKNYKACLNKIKSLKVGDIDLEIE